MNKRDVEVALLTICADCCVSGRYPTIASCSADVAELLGGPGVALFTGAGPMRVEVNPSAEPSSFRLIESNPVVLADWRSTPVPPAKPESK